MTHDPTSFSARLSQHSKDAAQRMRDSTHERCEALIAEIDDPAVAKFLAEHMAHAIDGGGEGPAHFKRPETVRDLQYNLFALSLLPYNLRKYGQETDEGASRLPMQDAGAVAEFDQAVKGFVATMQRSVEKQFGSPGASR